MNKYLKPFSVFMLIALLLGLSACASTASRESTGQYIDSAATTTKVKTKLARVLGARSIANIQVSTYKGVVQLSGFVKSQREISKAAIATKTVPGVKAVENSLLVRGKLP